MDKKLSNDIMDIRNLILSFSVLIVQEKINEVKNLKSYNVSDRILIFAPSKFSMNKHIKSMIDNSGKTIEELNKEFFMCVSFRQFKKNKLYFGEMILLDHKDPRGVYALNERSSQILEFNRKVVEINDPTLLISIGYR